MRVRGRALLVLSAVVWAAASGVAGGGGELSEARARAWAVRVSVFSEDPRVFQIADASARGGASPVAEAVALAADGESPWRAVATPANREQAVHPLAYEDPTGSLHANGAFAEAHATEDGSGARTGLGSVSGSGFALADELFTWDQQEELMTMWVETNAAVFDALNGAAQALGPVLALAGLATPRFDPAPAMGWIDFGRAGLLTAAADAASGPSLSSARSEAVVESVRLFGGFVEARGVAVEAVSESAGGADVREASVDIEGLKIAGIDVVTGGDGLRVAGNDIVSRSILGPLLDLALELLSEAGVAIRVAETVGDGDLRQAVALELEVAAPEATFRFSVGYAEASAASTDPFRFEDPAPVPAAVAAPSPTPGGAPTAVLETELSTPTRPAPSVGEPAALGSRGPVDRRLPESVARAMRTAYLLLAVVGGLLGALAIPMVTTRRARRTPVPITKEVER